MTIMTRSAVAATVVRRVGSILLEDVAAQSAMVCVVFLFLVGLGLRLLIAYL